MRQGVAAPSCLTGPNARRPLESSLALVRHSETKLDVAAKWVLIWSHNPVNAVTDSLFKHILFHIQRCLHGYLKCHPFTRRSTSWATRGFPKAPSGSDDRDVISHGRATGQAGEAQTSRQTSDIPAIWGDTGCGSHTLAADARTLNKCGRGPLPARYGVR